MSNQELIDRLNVAPGDFVTLDHEQAKRCREAVAFVHALQTEVVETVGRTFDKMGIGKNARCGGGVVSPKVLDAMVVHGPEVVLPHRPIT